MNLNSCVVKVNGLIDLESTLKNVASDVMAWNTVHVNDQEKIEGALAAVFAQYPSAKITKPALVTLTLGKLEGMDPNTIPEMTARINEVVDAQTVAGVLTMRKGRDGGYSKVAEQPATA